MEELRNHLYIQRKFFWKFIYINSKILWAESDCAVFRIWVVTWHNAARNKRTVVFKGSFKLFSCNCAFQSSYKDSIAIFVKIRSKYDFVLANLTIFKSLKSSVSSFRRIVLNNSLISFNSYFFSEFSLFSKLLLTNTKITFRTLSSYSRSSNWLTIFSQSFLSV